MNENKTMDIYSRGEGENNMQTLPISEETREKLEEATLSVFMDQYAKALDAGVDSLMEDCAEDTFPPELDQRIQKLIAKESAKERNKKRRKTALRMLCSAAAAIVLLLGTCSVLFVTVEAFRLPIMNFFVEKTDRYWELSGVPNTDKIPDAFNPENPLDGILPDDFELVSLDGSWEEGCLTAEYCNGDKAIIYFSVDSVSSNVQIDTEGSLVSSIKVNGHDAKLSMEGDCIRLSWIDANTSKMFALCTTNIAEESVMAFADILMKSWN